MAARFTIRSRGREDASPSAEGFEEPVARRPSPENAGGCGAALFGVFLLAGLGFSAVFLVPAWRHLQALSWPEVPCEILESRVESHSGDDGTTYSVEVRYRYTLDGRDYTSDRYRFLGGSSSGFEGKARVVERLPPGTRTVCYADPEDPSEAVLNRGFDFWYLLVLFPLVFVAVGAGGIAMSLAGARRLKARRAAGRADWLPEPEAGQTSGPLEGAAALPSRPAGSEGSLVLEPKMSPVGRLGCITAIALFWNGIVGVFLWHIWESWRDGSPEGCLTVFIIPFALIGALLLVGVPYQLLALFNPRPRLILTPGRIELGGSSELSWRFEGWPSRIRRLRITLEGVEEADIASGDSRRTEKETFATYDLLDTSLGPEIAGGSIRVGVPADTMHTFEAPGHRILWTLKLHGTIRLWPDVLEEVPVVIRPRPLDELAREAW